MNGSIERNVPKQWCTTITTYEIRELWMYIKKTTSQHLLNIHDVSLFTPIFTHGDVVIFMEVCIRLTKTGRDAAGAIVLQRILKTRRTQQLRDNIESLSQQSVSTRRSRCPLLSYGQIIQTIVDVLNLDVQNERILSPSGHRRLKRNQHKQQLANTLLDPLRHGNLEDIKQRLWKRKQNPSIVFKLKKSSTIRESDDGDSDSNNGQEQPHILEVQRRKKETERQRRTCGLCEHVFPVSSMPSSITKGEISRVRKKWKDRSDTAGQGLSQTEKLRFSMKYGGLKIGDNDGSSSSSSNSSSSNNNNSNNTTTPNSNILLVSPLRETKMIKEGDRGFFQVSQVRKPLCVLCHDLLGRQYDVVGRWKPSDPSPSDSWLKLHGITHNVGEKLRRRKNHSPRSLLSKIIPKRSLRELEGSLGIYEDVEESDEENEQNENTNKITNEGENENENDTIDVQLEEKDNQKYRSAEEFQRKKVTVSQMHQDVEVLLAEQKLLHEEIEEVRKARLEIKIRRKRVNDLRRERAKGLSKVRAKTQVDFFSG